MAKRLGMTRRYTSDTKISRIDGQTISNSQINLGTLTRSSTAPNANVSIKFEDNDAKKRKSTTVSASNTSSKLETGNSIEQQNAKRKADEIVIECNDRKEEAVASTSEDVIGKSSISTKVKDVSDAVVKEHNKKKPKPIDDDLIIVDDRDRKYSNGKKKDSHESNRKDEKIPAARCDSNTIPKFSTSSQPKKGNTTPTSRKNSESSVLNKTESTAIPRQNSSHSKNSSSQQSKGGITPKIRTLSSSSTSKRPAVDDADDQDFQPVLQIAKPTTSKSGNQSSDGEKQDKPGSEKLEDLFNSHRDRSSSNSKQQKKKKRISSRDDESDGEQARDIWDLPEHTERERPKRAAASRSKPLDFSMKIFDDNDSD